MAISKDKVRVSITLSKTALDLIDKFASATKFKSKSEFIESVCCTFIADVVNKQKAQNNKKSKKVRA